jgi:heme-degrading monooxygenase HmoA
MYVVILKATVGELDQGYKDALEQMKVLAFEQYGCLEFTAMMEGNKRMALSYWENEDQIKKWKRDIEHLKTQSLAQNKWYKNYTVQVAEITREYSFNR